MEACSLCNGRDWETIEEVGSTRVVRCSCGLVFVTPPPARSMLEQAYGEAYYRPWEDQVSQREWMWARRMRRVEALAESSAGLLDVGCGTGVFLQVAQARGWNVTGTEISPYAVRTAKARGLSVIQGELWEAGLPGDAFNVATCWHVIEHVLDPKRLLAETHRILKPGGWLVLATPNLNDRIFRAAYRVARRRRPRLYEPDEREIHLFHFTARTLAAMAAAVGFEVLEVGFDREAAVERGKRAVNELAYFWYKLSGLHWGMALELIAKKPTGLPGKP
jgi:2-polyprenyl-3-methyl-5-hydroxy-6-metoxy-1,4-benzoquinol methylase